MDEATFSGVNEGASIPSSGDSSSPMATDSGGIQEATPAQVPGADSTTAQVATQEESGDATAQEEADPFDEQVAQVPEHQREKFNSLLQHKKDLERDLKAARSQWQPLTEQYGDVQTIAEKLAQLEGLGSYATDQIGETVIGPNGLPQVTTAPWISKMAETSPAMVEQLSYDLFNQPTPDGQTYGAKLFWQAFQEMGLDPSRVQDYAQLPASQVAASQATADELEYIDPSLHKAYNYLTKPEREFVQSKIYDAKDDEVAEYLQAANRRMENEARLQEFTNYQKQQEEAEISSYWQNVDSVTNQVIQEANNKALTGISQQIESQVQFSSDPTANKLQTGMVSALVAAMCSPQTRFAVQPILEQIGATIDPQIDQLLTNATQAERVYQAYAQLEKNDKPEFKKHRNEFQMKEARRESDRLQQQAMAKLAPIAVKIAKAIAGGNQGIREASQQDLAKINSRPAVGNGGIPGARSGQPVYPPGKEFDFSYRPN